MRTSEEATPSRPTVWTIYANQRFGVLLVLLIGVLAGPPLFLDAGLSTRWFEGLVSVLLLAVIVSLCLERRQRLFALALGVPTILFLLGGHALTGGVSTSILFLGQLCQIVFLFGAAGMIVRSLFSASELTFDSLLGAVCGYLLLGLGWAVAYSMVDRFRPGSFDVSPPLASAPDAPRLTPQVLTYYSFVTLTTVGYGDITPIRPAARTLAWMEAIVGQFYVAIIVAGLVSMIVAKQSRAPTSDHGT